MLPAALSIVMNMFEEGAERNKALGIWGGLGAAGATVGLIAGGLLTRYAGWQYIFYLNVPIGATALLLAPRIVPESRLATEGRRFEVTGAMMAIGMTLIGAGVIWATQVPVHGHFLPNLAAPFVVAGAGTAFAFIPISIAGPAGVAEHQAGLASGLLNTSQQLGGAIGIAIAIASSVAASHTEALVRAGNSASAALTGGFQEALWVLGAIALLAVPVIFVLVRRDELSSPATTTTLREAQPALTATS
jgi:hypothetical protein